MGWIFIGGGVILPKPVKQAATISEHIDLLRGRGMEVDTDLAQQWLSFVSYYRLSAYWYPAREMTASGTRKDTFVPGTRFSDAVDLYEADRKLRSLVHDGMERIEIAMRTRIGEVLCEQDPLTYRDPSRFRTNFNHQNWMSTVGKRLQRAGSRNESIKHYRAEYAGEYPFWVLAEVLDFADISRLFEGLPSSDQRRVTEDLGISIDLSVLSRNQQRKVKMQPPARAMDRTTHDCAKLLCSPCPTVEQILHASTNRSPAHAAGILDASQGTERADLWCLDRDGRSGTGSVPGNNVARESSEPHPQ